MEKYMDKILIFAEKVQSNNYLKAISNGLMGTLAINIIGSIALLLAVLPIDPWKDFIAYVGIAPYLLTAYSLTVGVLSLYAAFLIGYNLARNFKQSPLTGAIISLFCFLMMTPMLQLEAGSTLDSSWLGAQGLFTAMISSLVFTRIYCFLMARKITIKMPESVPLFVSETFAGLLPAIIVGALAMLVSFGFGFTSFTSFSGFVYSIIATPLQSLSSSVWSLLFIVLIQMILWFFGIHGSLVVGSFITALYLPMDVANMDALAAGAMNSDLPNILGQSFYNIFGGIGGAGATLSLIIVILVFSKSKQNRTIANLSAVPGLFTINEPIVFGLPLILNPIMMIPFILSPLVQILIAYFGIASGIFPRLSGVQVPFGTPVLINGFIAGGWQIAVLQIICILAACLLYFPFVKLLDKQQRDEEKANLHEEVATEPVS
ncbi:PTS sugar transporter subunit IIC [Culicoidibacter larvae]|uniref:Permease IIC component n=1 Tax=Culicoidibacter larvae TaxID=2579976 RepID=A0A5R8QBH7_9FIRM|nr:PTS transporter subunit EIIC [Culicoidibacter larvae]TLG73931.1 PTS sugar transporter subunit IIC [Culicoidibacter larvae]